MDEAARKEVWEGKIPVCFVIDQSELGSSNAQPPEPCFMMLSRVSYFPFVFDKLESLYGSLVGKTQEDRIWFSYGQTPLKWHYPVGVLYDLHGQSCTLPWEITVHFKGYPEDQLLTYEGKALEVHYKSKMKEADWLKHKAEVINSMTPQEFSKLWQGFSQGSFDEFWSVNGKFMLNVRGEQEPFRHIPFCIYKNGERVYQRAVSGEDTTIGNLLVDYYRYINVNGASHKGLVQGIEIPNETPLQWLSCFMSNPDNFIHICVVPL